jgi:class 3 adenylate cyclase
MPLFMDVHRKLGTVTPEDLAQAHLKDVETQEKYGVHYHQYWLNEETGTVFCLVEGPDKASCDQVHREAHGLVADDLIEVAPGMVETFMGAVAPNPAGAAVTPNGSLDNACRIVLFTEVANYAEVAESAADDVALGIMQTHDRIVRETLAAHHGQEVRHTGEGIMAVFATASNALRFALQVQQKCAQECKPVGGHRPQLRIGIAAGEPVEADRTLFGVSVAAARRICEHAAPGEVLLSGAVRELAVGKGFAFTANQAITLQGLPDAVATFTLHAERPAPAPQLVARPKRAAKVQQFWAELKRRHVVTVAAVYGAVLFILLQVAQLTFAPLRLPEWTYTLLVVLGLFGFPLAMVLAWMFDLDIDNSKTDVEKEKARR